MDLKIKTDLYDGLKNDKMNPDDWYIYNKIKTNLPNKTNCVYVPIDTKLKKDEEKIIS